MRPLELFEARLAAKPYRCDDFSFGLKIQNKEKAIKKRHIQFNNPHSINAIVLDIDKFSRYEMIESEFLPVPNIVIKNPENKHLHIVFLLENPIACHSKARIKPRKFLSAVERRLIRAFKADEHYTGLMVKNPLHPDAWEVEELRLAPWDLHELSEYLTLGVGRVDSEANDRFGRNCTLFDQARKWRYKQVQIHKSTGSFDSFEMSVQFQLEKWNQNFSPPLSSSEVRGITKSISRWVWTKYTGRVCDADFSRLQSERGKKGGRPSKTNSKLKPWLGLGITRDGYYKRLKRATTKKGMV